MATATTLTAFLADRAALLRARGRAEAFSRAWHSRIEVTDATMMLDAAAALGGDAVQDVLVGLFADPDWAETLIAPMLGALRQDPWFEPPVLAVSDDVQRGLLLIECAAASIVLVRLSASALAKRRRSGAGAGAVVMPGALGVIHVVRSGGAALRRWEAEPIDAGYSLAQAGAMTGGERVALVDGQTLRIDGRVQAYEIADAGSDILLLRAAIHVDRAPFQREFDTASGMPIGASDAREEASRIRMMLSMLRSTGCTEAEAAFVAALAEPEFDLRWHAMHEWLLLDSARAMPWLQRIALEDPHHEVRAAAHETLARIALREISDAA